VETDVLDNVVSAVYSQKHRDKLYLIVYFSRKIISAELNYNITDKELLAIIEVLRE
jgi:hypothetical protein